jgi:hypothetical protein
MKNKEISHIDIDTAPTSLAKSEEEGILIY